MRTSILYILLILIIPISQTIDASTIINNSFHSVKNHSQNPNDRKLSEEEVQQRGLDLMANQIIENIDEIDLRKMARSSIFETSFGFRWKMFNLSTGNIIIIKVNKNFELISARNSKNSSSIMP